MEIISTVRMVFVVLMIIYTFLINNEGGKKEKNNQMAESDLHSGKGKHTGNHL